ncbi:MAG: MBL fold metallo-hydrolase [Bacteroidales bacterium]|nr:MBL fold metallo-hydrolase [Bacteroidales bacterium]
MDIRRFIFNPLSENTLIVSGVLGKCVVVDPGFLDSSERDSLLDYLKGNGLVPEAVLLTHGHMDHVYGVAALQRLYGMPVYMSGADWPVLNYFQKAAKFGIPVPDLDFRTTDISDGQTIGAGGLEFKVIATPGHSPGCVCYLEESDGTMFTGDTLFAGAIGRTDLYLGDYDSLIRNVMEKLMTLPGDITVYPGHGAPTTIGHERMTNPFLEPFNEPQETIYDQD